MRILFIRFPLESTKGGAENQTMWLTEGLKSKGHTVSFFGSCKTLLTTFSAVGMTVSKLNIGQPPVTKFGAISFVWRRKKMFRDLVSWFESIDELPEAVYMLSLSEKILMTNWLASRGSKVFWIEHDRIGSWLTKNPWLPSLKTASRNATIICVSKLSRQKYIDLGFDASHVIAIPNGVPVPSPSLSSLVTTHYPLPPTPYSLTIGTIARLSPEKGIDVLIAAISNIPEASLTIVGEGKEEAFLRLMMQEDEKRIGCSRITLHHHVSDLDLFLTSLDIFVLASVDQDPFGLVAAEAMMRGIPTIVTDQCGIAEFLTNGSDALIVEAGSSDALRRAIIDLKDDDLRQKIGSKGRETAKKLFGLEKMIESYSVLLHNIKN